MFDGVPFSEMNAKMKELGPVEGGREVPGPLNLPMFTIMEFVLSLSGKQLCLLSAM